MRQLLLVTLCTLALALSATACDSGTEEGGQTCSPNLQAECPCGGGVMGIQACREDGSGWTACDCGGGGGVCTPTCDARVCGDDGCGGSCGTCGVGEVCDAGACLTPATSLAGQPCDENGEETCDGDRAVVVCSGGAWLETQDCGDGQCQDAVCLNACTADCADRACGDDGCGESCGSCPPGESCDNVTGQCAGGSGQCVPNVQKQCVEVDGIDAVYWFDSCGEQGDWVETCAEGDYCSAGGCVETCQYHAAKRCSGDTIYWYDSCGVEEGPAQICEPWEYCKHSGETDAKCLKGLYAGQWMVKASPPDPMFYDNVFTLTEDDEANTVTFEENIPGFGTAYYTGELDGKLLIAEGSYNSGGVSYDITIQITFSVPPDTAGVAPTEFEGFWSTDPTMDGIGSLGAIVTTITGEKQ